MSILARSSFGVLMPWIKRSPFNWPADASRSSRAKAPDVWGNLRPRPHHHVYHGRVIRYRYSMSRGWCGSRCRSCQRGGDRGCPTSQLAARQQRHVKRNRSLRPMSTRVLRHEDVLSAQARASRISRRSNPLCSPTFVRSSFRVYCSFSRASPNPKPPT